MRRNMIETVMGAVVLLVAVAFIVVAFRSASLSSAGRDGYQVTVEFSDASGLAAGTYVRLAGVKIGTVMEQRLNPEPYFAVVTLGVSNAVRLPSDTSARIIPDGLLGGKIGRAHVGTPVTNATIVCRLQREKKKKTNTP